MTDTKTMFSMRLSKKLVERLDLYRARLPYRVDRTAVIEKAIADHLDREGAPPLEYDDAQVASKDKAPAGTKAKKGGQRI